MTVELLDAGGLGRTKFEEDRTCDMFQFSLRSMMCLTAFLMLYIVALTGAPPIVLFPLLVPGFVAAPFLPFVLVQLLGLVLDAQERTFESDRLQNCLFATFVCVVAICPWFVTIWRMASVS